MKHILPYAAISFLGLSFQSNACTRVVYHGDGGRVLTARTMDWKDDMLSNLWILPRGMERNGQAGENSISWTAKYGSVVTTAYDFATVDGTNEAGLCRTYSGSRNPGILTRSRPSLGWRSHFGRNTCSTTLPAFRTRSRI